MTDIPDRDSRLLRSKLRRAEEGVLPPRPASPDPRLPPGQRAVKDWPVLDLGRRPEWPCDPWTLEVSGAVRTELWLGPPWMDRLQQAETVADIHCVTGWSRLDSRFGGVSTSVLAEMARPLPGARFVMLHSADGYTTNLSLEDFLAPGAMVATSFEGLPLTDEHGGPARFLAPHLYLWKSAKWLTRVEFLLEDAPGFWEERGYHRRGDPWAEQRYALSDGSFYPRAGRPLPPERRADAEGRAAIAALEAVEAGLGGNRGSTGPRPWWRRLTGL